MPIRETEAIILRSYPLREADKIVSFFSREGGRIRGVAPNARRSLKRFGAGLELLSYVRLRYQEQEARDLVRLESCELLQSFFDGESSYEIAVAYSYIAEVCEQLLPEREANDPFFRLVLVVRDEIGKTSRFWRPLTYFNLWAVKLAGFLPSLDVCSRCQSLLKPDEPAWFRRQTEGVLCRVCRSEGSSILAAVSRSLTSRMLLTPLGEISDEGWDKSRAQDLRKFLTQRIEQHIERKLITRPPLEDLS